MNLYKIFFNHTEEEQIQYLNLHIGWHESILDQIRREGHYCFDKVNNTIKCYYIVDLDFKGGSERFNDICNHVRKLIRINNLNILDESIFN